MLQSSQLQVRLMLQPNDAVRAHQANVFACCQSTVVAVLARLTSGSQHVLQPDINGDRRVMLAGIYDPARSTRSVAKSPSDMRSHSIPSNSFNPAAISSSSASNSATISFGGAMLHRLVRHFLVAIDREIVIGRHDLRLRHAEALRGARPLPLRAVRSSQRSQHIRQVVLRVLRLAQRRPRHRAELVLGAAAAAACRRGSSRRPARRRTRRGPCRRSWSW